MYISPFEFASFFDMYISPFLICILLWYVYIYFNILICRQETEEIAQENTAEEEKRPSERFSSLSTTKNIASTTIGESEKNIISTRIGESKKNITSTNESEWGSCRSEAWHCFSSNMEVFHRICFIEYVSRRIWRFVFNYLQCWAWHCWSSLVWHFFSSRMGNWTF